MSKKWGKCDFRELEKYKNKIDKLANADIDKFCIAVSKELAARLLAKVIPRTPVGTKPEFLTKAPKRKKYTGEKGKSKSFLTKEGSILERYWAGYAGGTLRRGWTARTESEAKNGNTRDPKEYADSLGVIKMGNNFIIIVENPVSYAYYVEHGHRQEVGRYVPQLGRKLKNGWVEGKFMLTISEKELQNEADKIIEQRLNKFLKECFENG